jgi:error-prone DNA polymerase
MPVERPSQLPDYAELHCLSNFSFLRGASHPQELVRQAARLGYAALAITDECSVAGVVRAHSAAKETGLPLIIGAEFVLADGPKLVLLATDRAGYAQLCTLITAGRRRAKKGEYRLSRADFDAGIDGGGCVALLVPGGSPDIGEARWFAERFRGRGWIEVALHLGANDRARLAALRALGRASGLPLVAAGDVHMSVASRQALQDVLTAIRLGKPVHECGTRLYPNAERHLRMRSRIAALYPPELLAATLEIAARCRFDLGTLRYEYPAELVPERETPASYLRHLTEKGLAGRFPGGIPEKVSRLVDSELRLIARLGYEAFFLTVHDIVTFARSQDILCQGRGSAANSAVCYALGITEVDPERSELLFERFVSEERNEPPDIDVDFEHERREEVIQYVYGKYGRDRAALAATVISYRPRSAMRDVGKALGFAPVEVDRISKSLAWWDGRNVMGERLAELGFDPAAPRVRMLIELVRELVGFPRHLSQHVGGFVISRGPLSELVPIENAAMENRCVIQWDKDDLEELKLLKVDVLALGMLTAIRKSLALIAGLRGSPFGMADVPPEDPAVYAMLQRADSVGVFQVESRAQMSMLPRLKPQTFYDLVIEVAIVRPGPIQGGMVHPYLKRRQGLEPVTYHSPEVEKVLSRTLGVPIFQEQVMRLAIVAAGFTPGEADQLRRSMAAWKRKGGLEHHEKRLKDGMRERGYPQAFADAIFRQILGFGEYGFPESHAASFALLVYVSAWIKRHEPAAFLAGLLNSQPMGFYAPAQLIQDARRHDVEVRPVDALASEWECTLERMDGSSTPATRLGLAMVKGLSQETARRIVAARRSREIDSIDTLARRAALDRRELRLLAAAGAFASLAGHRRNAYWSAAGIELRRDLLREAPGRGEVPPLAAPSEGEDLVADYASLGFTLGRHPLALLRERLKRLGYRSAESLASADSGKWARACGIVTGRQRPDTASGVIFVTLEDETGNTNLVVWNDVIERQRRELLGARLLGVEGLIQRESGVTHLVARRLFDLTALLGKLHTESRDFH